MTKKKRATILLTDEGNNIQNLVSHRNNNGSYLKPAGLQAEDISQSSHADKQSNSDSQRRQKNKDRIPSDFMAKYIIQNGLSKVYQVNNGLPPQDEMRMTISYLRTQLNRKRAVNDEHLKEMKVKLMDRMK